jgi:hypothetical protein
MKVLESDMAGEPMWRIRIDLASARVLLWVATASRAGEVKPEVHRYLGDRYWRLAHHHFHRGHNRWAERLESKARWHLRLGGGDDPTPSAALAMPVPRRPTLTRAIGRLTPDDAA